MNLISRFLCFLVWPCFVLLCSGSVDRIPTPNVCSHAKGYNWQSSDCPSVALCVPIACIASPTTTNSTGRMCSCTFNEMMLFERDGGKCVPTTATYAYGINWLCQAFVAGLTFHFVLYTFWRAHKHNVLKIDVFYLSGLFNLFSSGLYAVLCVLYALYLIQGPNVSDVQLYQAITFVYAFVAASTVATATVLGLAAFAIVFQSSHLQRLNVEKMRHKITRITLIATIATGLGGVVLFFLRDYATAFAYFGGFSLLVWGLFRGIVKYSMKMTLSHADTDANSPSSPSTHTTIQPHTTASLAALSLNEISLLARRVSPLMLGFAVLCLVYNLLWYLGRKHCNRTALGPASAATIAVLLSSLLFGYVNFAVFMKRMVELRIQYAIFMKHNSALAILP